ncbi:MAG: molybdopterin-dependent oxidoreductase, partial [Chloroflexi bacterium]|nr:molybdopterin-dependent oxidoreductase [Chloroflexota bacterium]
MNIKLSINDTEIEAPDGSSVLDVINASGTYISQLCKDPDMKAIGACRTCLVQIEGVRGYPASCSVPATDGMKVWTNTPEAEAMRRGVIELTLAMFPENGDASKDYKELTLAAKNHDITEPRWGGRERHATDDSNPVFSIAMDSCILCQRCVQACQDGHQFIGAIDMLGAGTDGRIGTFVDRPLLESVCTTCGQCFSVCPTGAIELKRPAPKIARTVSTTCPYCGVGCGILAQVDDMEQLVAVQDDPDNQSSLGMLCVKGRFGFDFVNHPDRLTTPLIRKNGELTPASWEEALNLIVEKLSQYRGDSFGCLCSAKATNEDGYIQQKFSRLVMQSNNIDHCTRLCHAPSVEAMLVSLGSGATSNSYVDYEEAGCLVIIGSDANSNHPVAASRMRRAVVERGAKLIIINPRRIDMCDYADIWMRPRPGTDVALLNGMARVILEEGLADEEFVSRRTEGFEEWKQVVDKYTLEHTEGITGVPAEDIATAARIYASPPFSGSCLIWGM